MATSGHPRCPPAPRRRRRLSLTHTLHVLSSLSIGSLIAFAPAVLFVSFPLILLLICEQARVDEVVRLAKLDGLVSRLPQGLDTLVGERGLKLSGGEKQVCAHVVFVIHGRAWQT